MGFFKDFKDDFSEAVSELMPSDDDFAEEEDEETQTSSSIESDIDIEKEMQKIDSLLSDVSDEDDREAKKRSRAKEPVIEIEEAPVVEDSKTVPDEPVVSEPAVSEPAVSEPAVREPVAEQTPVKEPEITISETPSKELENEIVFPKFEIPGLNVPTTSKSKEEENVSGNAMLEIEEAEEPAKEVIRPEVTTIKEMEEVKMDTMEAVSSAEDFAPAAKSSVSVSDEIDSAVKTDETTVITSGTRIVGNIDGTGSVEIQGSVTGDVKCNGKLTVTGSLIGNSSSSEFFADTSKIEGEIMSTGTVKVGMGSVIIGNVTATSAVIAGAIKGDIDIQGPVVIDSSAVIVGNIKSKSVQINNGAVIEGFCSQCYSDIDTNSLFEKEK